MIGWPVVAAWGAALLVGIVILLFCTYELRWKAARLQRDQARLHDVVGQLGAVAQELATAQTRLDAARRIAGR